MAEKRRKLSRADEAEMTGYLDEAKERHVTLEAGIVPHFVTHVVDVDVNLAAWGKTLHAGSYMMKVPDKSITESGRIPEESFYLWTIELPEDSVRKMIEDAESRGSEGQRTEPFKFDITLRRVDVAEGRPLLIQELMAWLAIQDADNEGDTAKADRIFYLAYGQHRDPNGYVRPSTIRVTEEFPQLLRAKTRGRGTKGIRLKNRKGEEITRITAVEGFLDLKPSGRKTLVKLNEEATKLSQSGEYRHDGETVCRVILGVKETAKLYGITEASARKRIRRDFKAIANENITVKKGKNWVTIPVAGDSYGIIGDNAFFAFSPTFMQMLLSPKAPQVDLPPEIYGTDDQKYPAALQIGFKLYNHDNLNSGRPNQDRMKLTTLLDAATEIPKAGTVNRHETEKIMGPFEATMDHLVDKGVLADWDYCHENGDQLTDEEYQAIQTEHELGKPTPWSLAEGLLVTWELGTRFPEHEQARQASRDRRNAKALEAKTAKEKEARARERRVRRKVETMEAKERHEAQKKVDA